MISYESTVSDSARRIFLTVRYYESVYRSYAVGKHYCQAQLSSKCFYLAIPGRKIEKGEDSIGSLERFVV